ASALEFYQKVRTRYPNTKILILSEEDGNIRVPYGNSFRKAPTKEHLTQYLKDVMNVRVSSSLKPQLFTIPHSRNVSSSTSNISSNNSSQRIYLKLKNNKLQIPIQSIQEHISSIDKNKSLDNEILWDNLF